MICIEKINQDRHLTLQMLPRKIAFYHNNGTLKSTQISLASTKCAASLEDSVIQDYRSMQ